MNHFRSIGRGNGAEIVDRAATRLFIAGFEFNSIKAIRKVYLKLNAGHLQVIQLVYTAPE